MSTNEPPEYPSYGSMPDQGSTPPPPPSSPEPPSTPPEQPPAGGYGPPAPPPYQPPPGGWQQPPPAGFPPPAGQQYYAPPPTSQKGLWAMILGISALASIPLCAGFFGLAIVASIAAIIMGAQAKGEIARSQGAISGSGQAQAGFITGIVGTVLLGIGLVFFIGLVASF